MTGSAASLPWAEWFHFGVAVLGMRPDDFWALSLDEWRWLIAPARSNGSQHTLTRAGFDALRTLYPDTHYGQ